MDTALGHTANNVSKTTQRRKCAVDDQIVDDISDSDSAPPSKGAGLSYDAAVMSGIQDAGFSRMKRLLKLAFPPFPENCDWDRVSAHAIVFHALFLVQVSEHT